MTNISIKYDYIVTNTVGKTPIPLFPNTRLPRLIKIQPRVLQKIKIRLVK
jgi:hypothetical protein